MSIYSKFKSMLGLETRSASPVGNGMGVMYLFSDSVGNGNDKLSVVYGCVRLKANSIAQLPISIYKKEDSGNRNEAKEHPIYGIITNPNTFQTTYDLIYWIVSQLELNGNAYLRKVYNVAGTDVVGVFPIPKGPISLTLSKYGEILYNIDGEILTSNDIIHFKQFSDNGWVGVSPLERHRNLINRYADLEEQGTAAIKNTAKPNGIIKHKFTNTEDIEKLKTTWETGFSGENTGKMAYLPEGKVEFVPFPSALNLVEAQYIENLRYSAQRIAADIFSVPPHMLNLSASPTYASVEAQSIEYVKYSLAPIIKVIESTFNKAFGLGEEYYIKISVQGLLQGDTTARLNYYNSMLNNGVMTPNQVAALEDLGHIIPENQGGDSYRTPLNMKLHSDKQT